MPWKSRVYPVIAGFVILVLTCSQLIALGGQSSLEQLSKPGEANKKTPPGKQTKKRKKKKKKTAPSNFFVMNPSVQAESGSSNFGTAASATQDGTGRISAPSRGTNRAARTPRVHITPVGIIERSASSFSASNSSPITIDSINPTPGEPIPAIPFSSDIDVLGLTGIVTSVSVSINGLTHSFPDDIDMLLVSPNGKTFHFWSDVGGGLDNGRTGVVPNGVPGGVENVTIVVSDTGNTVLPDDGPLVDGTTYRPFNNDTVGDDFPLPAQGPPYNEPILAGAATFTSVFAGMTGEQAGGTWQLFVTDDRNGDGGQIAGGWTLNITTQVPPTTAGQLIISEFRTKGPNGSNDEFVELYNTTGAPLVVQASDASQGLGVAASDGFVRCIVPNGTIIPKGGHYLCANGGSEESMRRTIKGRTVNLVDQSYGLGIPDNAGIALFSSSASNSIAQSLGTRLDAVGSTTEENPLFKEGTGYPAISAQNLDHSFYRDMRPGGEPKDTGNNAADFLFVDTNATVTEAGQRLGSPGPQGLTDSRLANDAVVVMLGFPCKGVGEIPNRIRSMSPDIQGNSNFGTLGVVKAVTNFTANDISTLRFRVFDMTTAPAPVGVADLRWLNSANQVYADVCGSEDAVQALGITLDGPSRPLGGGFNTSGTVNLAQPLVPGETILVNFLWGVQQTGSFRVYVNIEVLP